MKKREAFIKLSDVKYVNGYLNGIRQPSVMGKLSLPMREFPEVRLSEFQVHASSYSFSPEGHLDNDQSKSSPGDLANIILLLCLQVLSEARHFIKSEFIIDKGRLTHEGIEFSFQCPCLGPNSFLGALQISVFLVEAGVSKRPVSVKLDNFPNERRAIKGEALKGFNTTHLLACADERSIPWKRISNNIYILGYGSRSRFFESSVTDETGALSLELVRNKKTCANLLAKFGFPTTKSVVASSQNDINAIFCNLKKPLVAKPIDADGGENVFAWIEEEAELITAYEAITKTGRQCIVEEHFFGRDYRVHVVDGNVHGIVYRKPALVKGDGTSTVLDLIRKENYLRSVAQDDRRFLHQIKLGREAERMLKKFQLTLESIPSKGQSVQLSAAANISSGGEPFIQDLSQAHPDNIKLCLDVCRILRLNIAGVDLITSDISQSWKGRGAHICEINSQPQMFTPFFDPLLNSCFQGHGGRIPIIIVYEDDISYPLSKKQLSIIEEQGLNCAWVKGKVGVGDGVNTRQPIDWQSVERALVDPLIDSLLVTINDKVDLSFGWPFSYCDFFVFDESGLSLQCISKKITETFGSVKSSPHETKRLFCD